MDKERIQQILMQNKDNNGLISTYMVQKKSNGVMWALWWFAGIFGAHKFYAQKTGEGILYLILSITLFGLPITMILWLIDLGRNNPTINKYNLGLLELLINHK
jgi:TM2 domain-containing membrane protein YozV